MNQIPNIEEKKTGVKEEVEELIDALGVTEHRAIGFVKVIPTHSLRQLLIGHHQQLQKAREESVKALKVADNDIPPFPSAKDSESARIGFITGVAWARTRLHSELDQDNK